MITNRIIPVLTVKGTGLVKTIQFKGGAYIGDPINAIKIFNDKEVDEIVFLDITATPEGRRPRFDLIKDIAGECFMPLCYGGGIRTLDDIQRIFRLGAEKVAINSEAFNNPGLVTEAARQYGSQSVVVSIDVKRNWMGKPQVYINGGRVNTGKSPVEYAMAAEASGAGEIMITSIDRDGSMKGYDLQLIGEVSRAVQVPVIACGGAGSLNDLKAGIEAGAAAAAAGSLFVYKGPLRAVLINYPDYKVVKSLLGE